MADVVVDGKHNKAFTTLWIDKWRTKKAKQTYLDHSKALFYYMNYDQGEPECRIEKFYEPRMPLVSYLQRLWTPFSLPEATVYRGKQCLVIDSIKFLENNGERESKLHREFPSHKRLDNVAGTKIFQNALGFANKDEDGKVWQTFFDASGSEIIYSSTH